MITPAEFVNRWDESCIVHYDPIVVNATDLPNSAKDFLIQAGLPRHIFKSCYFDLPPNNLPFLSEVDAPYPIPKRIEHLRLIGKTWHDWNSPRDTSYFCLDESTGGCVVSIYISPDYPIEIMNTSIVRMVEMLLLFEEIRQWGKTDEADDRTKFQQRIAETAYLLRQIDPETLRGGKGWSEAIDCIESGM